MVETLLARQDALMAESKVLAEENKVLAEENKALAAANHDAQLMVDKLTYVSDQQARIINQVLIRRVAGITPTYPDNSFPISTAWCPCCLRGDAKEDDCYLVRVFSCGTVHRYGDPSRQWVKLCGDLPPAIAFGYIPKDGGLRRFVEVGTYFIVPRNAGVRYKDLTVDVNDPTGIRLKQLMGLE